MIQCSQICGEYNINFNKHHVSQLMQKLEHENFELVNGILGDEDSLIYLKSGGDADKKKVLTSKIDIAEGTIN